MDIDGKGKGKGSAEGKGKGFGKGKGEDGKGVYKHRKRGSGSGRAGGKGGGGDAVDLGQCRSPEDVVSILEGHEMSAQQAAHALHLITKLRAGSDAYLATPGWAHLTVQFAAACMSGSLQSRQISTSMYSLAKMGAPVDDSLGSALAMAIGARARELDTIGASNTLWACAKLGWTPSTQCCDALLERAATLLPQFNSQDLANTVVGLGGLHAGGATLGGALLAALHVQIGAKAREMRPLELCTTFTSLAQLPSAPAATLTALLASARAYGVGRLSARDVAMLVHALGKCASPSNAACLENDTCSFVFEAVGAKAAAGGLNAQDVSTTLIGLAALMPLMPHTGRMAHTLALIQAAAGRAPHAFSAQQVANSIWSLAKLLPHAGADPDGDVAGAAGGAHGAPPHADGARVDTASVAALLARAGECTDEFTPQNMSNFLCGVVRLGLPLPAHVAARVAAQLASRVDRYDANALSNCLWALVKLRARPEPATLSAALEHLATRLIPAGSVAPHEAARLLWCMGMLELDLRSRAERGSWADADESSGGGHAATWAEEGDFDGVGAVAASSLASCIRMLFGVCHAALSTLREPQVLASCVFALAKLKLAEASSTAGVTATALLVKPKDWRAAIKAVLQPGDEPSSGNPADVHVDDLVHLLWAAARLPDVLGSAALSLRLTKAVGRGAERLGSQNLARAAWAIGALYLHYARGPPSSNGTGADEAVWPKAWECLAARASELAAKAPLVWRHAALVEMMMRVGGGWDGGGTSSPRDNEAARPPKACRQASAALVRAAAATAAEAGERSAAHSHAACAHVIHACDVASPLGLKRLPGGSTILVHGDAWSASDMDAISAHLASHGHASAVWRRFERGDRTGTVLPLEPAVGVTTAAAAATNAATPSNRAKLVPFSAAGATGARAAAPSTPTSAPTKSKYDGCLLRVPLGRYALSAALEAVAPVLAPGAPLWLHGSTALGYLDRVLPPYFEASAAVIHAADGWSMVATARASGGPMMTIGGATALVEERIVVNGHSLPWHAHPSLFAGGGVDVMASFFMRALPTPSVKCRVLDLCAGSGMLAAALRLRTPSCRVHVTDADPLAIRAAALNLPGATATVSDGWHGLRRWREQQRVPGGQEFRCPTVFDMIVSNPPGVPISPYIPIYLHISPYHPISPNISHTHPFHGLP